MNGSDEVSNEKSGYLGWLGYIGDEKLSSFIGIITNHYKDPTSIMESRSFFFRGSDELRKCQRNPEKILV